MCVGVGWGGGDGDMYRDMEISQKYFPIRFDDIFSYSSLSSVSSWTTTARRAACPSTRRSPGRASTSSWSHPPPYRRPAASSSSTTRCPALPRPPPAASPGLTGPSSPSTNDGEVLGVRRRRGGRVPGPAAENPLLP